MLKHDTVKYAFLSSASSWIAHLGPHWFISFPEHLCRSDFPDTFIVYNTKDEKHNRQNEATDCSNNKFSLFLSPLRQKSWGEQEKEEVWQGVTQQKYPQRILLLPDAQYVNFTAAAQVEKDNEESSNPTQTTDNNEEAVMREETGQFMAQN